MLPLLTGNAGRSPDFGVATRTGASPYRSQQYIAGLFGSAVVEYWPFMELSGTVATGTKNSLNGSYSNVTLANTPGPAALGGRPAPRFVIASKSLVNVYSAGLNTAFNGNEGSLFIWCKVLSSGVWSDSTVRRIAYIGVDNSNRVIIGKSNSSGVLVFNQVAGGTAMQVTTTGTMAYTTWFLLGITWSRSANQFIAYINNAQYGTTQTGLGNYAGNLSSSLCVFGSADTSGTNPWSGWLGGALVLNRPATITEVGQIYRGS